MFNENDIIDTYSSNQAEEDGFLFNITRLNKAWKKGLFNFVTLNLLNKGYKTEKAFNIPNVLDLLNQCLNIVKTKSNGFKDFDHFFSGKIELPNGSKQEVYISQNDTGKFTLMLPEDY